MASGIEISVLTQPNIISGMASGQTDIAVGSATVAGQQLFQQAGSHVATPSSGLITITYPTPYTTTVVSVVANMGDITDNGLICNVKGTSSLTSFEVMIYTANNAPYSAAGVRVNWISSGT